MKPNKDYNVLLQQYNLAVQRYKDIKEQLETKKDQWQKYYEDTNITIKLMKELCGSIISKSREMNQLGKGKSWSDLEINEIIRLAKKVLVEYDDQRTDLMNKVADVCEERGNRIAELEELVLYYENERNNMTARRVTPSDIEDNDSDTYDDPETYDDTETSSDNDSDNTDNTSVKPVLNNLFSTSTKTSGGNSSMAGLFAGGKQQANTSTLSPDMQKKAKSGDVIFELAKSAKEDIRNGTATVIWEDEDEGVVEGDKTAKLHEENIRNNITSKPNKKSIKSVHSPKANFKKKMLKDKIEEDVYGEDIKNMVNKISEDNWLIIKAIGETGKSLVKDITGPCVKVFLDKGKDINARQITSKLSDLVNIGVLYKEVFATPLTSKATAFSLTAQGAYLYKKKFGKSAEISECDKVIQEHTTLSHGYGILQCGDIISNIKIDNKNIFTDVNVWNRKNPLRVGGADNEKSNILYIPDIVCTDKNGAITYIEYELNHHETRDFNIKNNKMLQLGLKRINYIVPNMDIAGAICERLVKWVESKGGSEVLRHIVIRVTTAKALDGHDIRRDSEWMFTMHPIKEKEFTKNF